MEFSLIYYLTICAPTIEKSLEMLDQYVEHGAREFQLDMPSQHPIYETELVKEYMRKALSYYDGYEPYMAAIREIRKKHPEIGLHCVLYPDVIEAITVKRLSEFVRENRISSVMVAGGNPETIAQLRQEGICTIGRIDPDLRDEQLKELSAFPAESYFNFNYKRHKERQPHGCASFKEKIDYIRSMGVKVRILAVEGIATGEMMREVRNSGANGALMGNALMRLWADQEELWKLFEEFQGAIR